MFKGSRRLIVLLAFFIPALIGSAHGQTTGLLRQVWEGIGGASVADLLASPNYPNNPTSQNYVTDLFESPTDILENYGQRMHGYVVPPITGNYTFWIATDDGGALYLGTDENPGTARVIAQVSGWSPSRSWTTEAGQQSGPIPLVAGKAYYVSALMKEQGGGDNLAVRWLMPNGVDQAPIVGTNLLPWGISFSPPTISRQPTNTTVAEGGTAVFTIQLGTIGPASYQWRRNSLDIPGATSPDLRFGPVQLSDQGARFSISVTNQKGGIISSEGVLTVTSDITPPSLVSVMNVGTRNLRLTFSEAVSAASALDPARYTLTPVLKVASVQPGATSSIVELTLDPMTYGASYTLAVSGVQDQALAPNTIAPRSTIAFTALEYSPATIGVPPTPGAVTTVPGGVDISGSGDVGTKGDVLEFAYQPVTGNFDRRVRLASFSPSDPFAAAGLMARATLNTNSLFAAALSTPAQLGSFFMARGTSGGDAARSGSYPPNYPETWLRLARAGNVFRAFASLDGTGWTELGNATIAMPATVLLGFAVGSHTLQGTATAGFRDAGDAVGATLVPAPQRRGETPGPSSRATALTVSEIMYHPRPRADGRSAEFIELYNSDLIAQDMTGFRISGSIDYTFPDGYRLPAGGYAVIARDPADLAAIYGMTSALGPFEGTNNLPNNRGSVRVRNANGAVILDAQYDNRPPWPIAADGAGHSLVLARPSYGEGDPRAWAASEVIGGSPGTLDTLRANAHAGVVINEILGHTDLPQLDTIELYNHGNSPVDIGGCILTDDATTNRFTIPQGTVLVPRGFLAFDETQLGFRLNAAGESIYLFNPNLTRVIDAVPFGPQENGVSSGRYPDGTPEWRRLRTISLGAENTPFRVSDIVINEIMYAPISGNADDQFVELYNRTAAPIDVSGWTLGDGVNFRFPRATTLPAGGYFVVARNRDRLLSQYRSLAPGVVFGNFSGSLSGRGERLALAMPDLIVSTNSIGLSETNRIDIEVDQVTYGTGGAWGQWSDGGGSSLELIDSNSDHLHPSNWADSDETTKAPWTLLEFTGRIDNVADGVATDRIHLVAFGTGEYMVDEVEVIGPGATNRLVNGSFTSGITGWTAQGNHRASSLSETEGIGGSRGLHVIAAGRGDTSVNRVRAVITPSIPVNSIATLRAKVRWMRGWPEFLIRTHGSGIEAFARLNVPGNLGTPGARNSRAVNNAGPAIFDVRHSPPVPRANEAVIVTARITDPDGIAGANLRYRLDPATASTTLAMRDDGTGGDAVAGDGIFSATISGRAAGVMVAFRVEATDLNAVPAVGVFPANAPVREALVRWGEERPFGNLGVYRLWQRQSDFNRLRSREPLANDNLDCTFVYGDERVIYNTAMRAKGSPFHGGSVGGDYLFAMPDDDKLLGDTDVALVTIGNLGSDSSMQREQAAFWIGERLGVAALHRRHGQFFENGGYKGLYEDTEEPNGQFVDSRFPDGPNGDLYKIEDWFEFDDVGTSFIFSRDATLQKFTTLDGSLKLARYRWAWRKRAVNDSSSDYAQFFQFVLALNSPGTTFAQRVDSLADIDSWMRDFATQHIVGNWDSYGYGRGKNSYLYLPPGGRWKIVPWDIDFVLGSGGDGPTADVFGSVDPTVSTLWNTPVFRRMYWRAFQDAINGPLREAEFLPMLEGRYRALVANGFTTIENPSAIRNFINQRRVYLQNRIAAEDVAALAITSNGGANFSTNRNIATLSGTAPIAVQDILVNGIAFPVTWVTVNTWSLGIPLGTATNALQLVGVNRLGEPVPGAIASVTVRYTGTPPRPEEFIVINEIQYHPSAPGSGFIEIYNTSPTGAFDLSGWRLDGAGFTFPQGTILKGGAFAVIATDLESFRNAYGTAVLPIGIFSGNLQNNGERLRLILPGNTPDLDQVIDEVRYDNTAPWPTNAAGFGPSLQLLDPRQDNRRVANWSAASTNAGVLATPGAANTLTATLDPFPTLWLNEVLPQNPAGITDSAGNRDPWVELYNAGTTTLDLSGLFLAASTTQLTEWTFPAGTTLGPKGFLVVWCDGDTSQASASELHTSFRLTPTNGIVVLSRMQTGLPAVLDYLAYHDLPAGKAWGSYPDDDPYSRQLFHLPTPGAVNNNGAPNLQVFINEWMASNNGAILDPADGDPDDWFELYNAGSTPADLSAFTLTDDLTHPEKARIPNGVVIPPGGYLLVWADEESGQTTNGQLHVNFKLTGTGEAIGLFAPNGAQVDALTFNAQSNNVSQGRFPDGGPPPFLILDAPSPAAPNIVGSANHPPSLQPIASLAVDEGATVTFRASATDIDAGQQLRFSLVGAPPTASIDPVSGAFSWLTTEKDGPGTFLFSVRVADDGAPPRFDSKPVTLTVRESNLPPVLDPITDRTVDEGQLLEFTLSASDPDLPAQKLTFSVEPGAPEGIVVNPATGVFTWAPTEDQGPGVYPIKIRVTDDSTPPLSATRTVNVFVNEVDNAPIVDPVGLQLINESVPFSIRITAHDPDTPASPLVFSLDTAPAGAAISSSGIFTWTPPESAGPGSYNIVVHVAQANGGPSTTQPFSITVNEVNDPPQLEAIADRLATEGDVVTFTARATDTDVPTQRLTFRLDPGAPAASSIDPQSGSFSWPIPPDAGASTNLVTVRVTDDAIDAKSASRTFAIVVQAQLRIVINEILHTAKVPRAEFVEIANLSTTTSWDIAGWQLTGLDFTFPAGSVIGPAHYLVVARDLAAFRAAYGTTADAVGNATLGFTSDGSESVRLLRPVGAGWETVDEVSFLHTAPWPAAANGTGASLQLIDARQDNRRPANWAALAGATTNAPRTVVTMTNVWRYKQDAAAPAGWNISTFNDTAWPTGPGLLYVENAALPEPKSTALVLTSGRMTYYFRTRFTFDGNPDSAALVLNTVVDDGFVMYLNGTEIHRLGMSPIPTAVDDSTAATRTVSDAIAEGPFTIPVTNLVAGTNVLAVEVHQTSGSSSDIVWGAHIEVLEVKRESATPGYANSVRATLTPFPDVWINEVLPRNTTGPVDNAGDRDPWIELVNTGSSSANLTGLWLTDDLANPRKWTFPPSSSLAPGTFRIVWADDESAEQTTDAWHAGFRLAYPRGLVALVRDENGNPAVLDVMNYDVTSADQAFGALSGTDPISRGVITTPTPGAPNVPGPDNRPPTLDAIADPQAIVGQPLQVDLHATDPDPGQSLAFSLTSAPTGMTIDAQSGRIRWTPTALQVGTYPVAARVDDSGNPSQSASRSFSVVVNPAPAGEVRITAIEVTALGELRLTWSTAAGRRYALQQGTRAIGGTWTQIGGATVAFGTSLSAGLILSAEPGSHFLRVVQLP